MSDWRCTRTGDALHTTALAVEWFNEASAGHAIRGGDSQALPCQQFGVGFDQPNPFCWVTATDALIVGTLLIAFSLVAITVAIGLRRLTWDVPTSIVIAGSIAAYTFPILHHNPEFRQLVAWAALGLALLIPTTLAITAIRLELKSKFS